MSIYEFTKGKKVDVDYETGYHFVITYLGDGKYMVNWIEESGLVVSQIADFANGRVYAFMTWPDENARGKRAELLHKGTLKIMD